MDKTEKSIRGVDKQIKIVYNLNIERFTIKLQATIKRIVGGHTYEYLWIQSRRLICMLTEDYKGKVLLSVEFCNRMWFYTSYDDFAGPIWEISEDMVYEILDYM